MVWEKKNPENSRDLEIKICEIWCLIDQIDRVEEEKEEIDRVEEEKEEMAMAMNSKEARRKKIMERGSDRLALITGQIQTLPSSSSSETEAAAAAPQPSQPLHSQSLSSRPKLLRQDQYNRPTRHLSYQTFVAPIDESGDPSTKSPKHDAENESLRNPAIETESYAEPQLRKCETNVDTIRTPALDISSKEQPCLVSSTNQTSSLDIGSKEQSCPVSSTTPDLSTADTELHPRVLQPRIHHPLLFTSRQISASISASENIRIFCSITIAVLVVLSHLSFPFGSSSIVKSIIAFRPLYLVLLTDITIVFARLLSMKQRGRAQAPSEDASWADGLGKMFDLGLLMYKAFTAAFMDFSVYAVVVICGLSLLQC